jgi:ABC-2 type transport system ATP-binding protein
MALAVEVHGLRKTYGDVVAVAGIDFTIDAGEVFSLLGPNGAGKTTTVEILEGYRERDDGDVTVLGADPAEAGSEFRERIGVVLQSADPAYPVLRAGEVVALFAGYFRAPRDVDEVLELVGLSDRKETAVRKLSGGQRRRLDLAIALVGDPELVFLDEPTTGFDPAARRNAWELIRGLRSLGKTILLTTHYLEEAEQLADRVAVINAGRIVALGRPSELTGREETEIVYRDNGREVRIETRTPTQTLHELTAQALADGRELEALEVRRRSLEDVYLALTEASE